MKRVTTLLMLTAFLLSSCGTSAPSLWGQYMTPTPAGEIPAIATSSAGTPPAQSVAINESANEQIVLPTPTATSSPPDFFVTQFAPTPTMSPPPVATESILYYAQNGDWLPAVARRFNVETAEITSPKLLPASGLLAAGTLLIIPDRADILTPSTSATQLIPDSEVVFSASATTFDIAGYVKDAGGYLSTYREYLNSTAWTNGAAEIERISYENSINPRLLLAILDYEANWVRGEPENEFRKNYPLGYENYHNKGLYQQLAWAINQLSTGYYGWRTGTISSVTFNDRTTYQLAPSLNAGTVAIMIYFAQLHSQNEWLRIMDPNSGFASFYANMFGSPWIRAESFGAIFPPTLIQPEMILPFDIGANWAFTGGPHGAWESYGPLAAIDFAPAADKSGCTKSNNRVLAIAPGLVIRSEKGIVVIDLDGDGQEQTGWNILYLHVAERGRVAQGKWVDQNEPIGYPSCEGGVATGTHVHIARKYNGEWITVDGPTPWVMSGWTVVAGDRPYQGKLVQDERAITADVNGQAKSRIVRTDSDD
ncbi:MAG: M23 family metallopeptidase [Anaerolineales bacterium]|nr:M23 family metallopeptidase [Anaerolineales bacterium]